MPKLSNTGHTVTLKHETNINKLFFPMPICPFLQVLDLFGAGSSASILRAVVDLRCVFTCSLRMALAAACSGGSGTLVYLTGTTGTTSWAPRSLFYLNCTIPCYTHIRHHLPISISSYRMIYHHIYIVIYHHI